ncbi:tRNA 4-thiouridine(8) synthase ThiI [Candidatus Haliotispira prima]|uniref:Probable tRNA sulfurtransferase n=1 Tax=Candidatus Haliotispira prima TaxID=3034016 RepID=A0ABY8MKR2_9SPIO|nr:tRNA 4-thiouridine(8) synthase ThiI [Candidatus Haliotispira prima]
MLYLLKLGELMLKKGNRRHFEQVLRRNIRLVLPKCKIQLSNGRFYLSSDEPGLSEEYVEERLATLPGIMGFAPVYSCAKSDKAIVAMVRQLAQSQVERYGPQSSFRVHVRRTDKSLPRDSQAYAVWLGSVVLEQFPQLKVRMERPDWSLKLELRDRAYLYHRERKGVGGLPVGTGGRGLLLLSGGIDSPVAGYLMACRGMCLEAVYFDTPPFTTDAAYDKVLRLTARLARWAGSGGKAANPPGVNCREQSLLLHRVPFTEVQLALRKHVSPAAMTLQSRACMVKLAEDLGRSERPGRESQALISGEALGQVASQTIENLSYTNSFARTPILRPLIGFDKEQIIGLSRQMGCFEISIEPHVDCCSYFAPARPVTQANIPELEAELLRVPGLEALMETALAKVETVAVPAFRETGK